jgi:hypothetical protein
VPAAKEFPYKLFYVADGSLLHISRMQRPNVRSAAGTLCSNNRNRVAAAPSDGELRDLPLCSDCQREFGVLESMGVV